MFKVLTFNTIAAAGLEQLPRERYEVGSEIARPDAILVRSHSLHDWQDPGTLRAVVRAGAGVNNIPVASLSARGVPVFNTPGANANAVKEMVLCGLLAVARNLAPAWEYVRDTEASGPELTRAVEAGKKQFSGFELPGRSIGVIGLGAVGVRVANAALSLGMPAVGFDPAMTVDRAWELSADVQQASSVGDVLARTDVVTLHVPMNDHTRHLLDADRIATMRDGAVLLNFAREGVVDERAVLAALDSGKLRAYVTDFPTQTNRRHPKVLALPHLGASTAEAEENCAVMAANQLRGFLEHGTLANSVNFPQVQMARGSDHRIAVVNDNVPNMIGQISTRLGEGGLNIVDMINKSRDDIAYTLVDVDREPAREVLDALGSIEGVKSVRSL